MSVALSLDLIDSHTGGEPTRVIYRGGPELTGDTLAARRTELARDHDWLRRAAILEPRGSDVLVGALLCPPREASSAAGVIFFNNVGYLGMCVHGTIGVVETLRYLQRIQPGTHRLETPVGDVLAVLHEDGQVSVQNVGSYRYLTDVVVQVPDYGTVRGDVAWGGNWFFLTSDHRETLELESADRLTQVAWRIRQALDAAGVRGEGGAEIDHIELFGPPSGPHADSRNFVLCPGKAYDRSPCGTGTSAKLACLWADGKLEPGQVWRQESIVGSVFSGSVQAVGKGVVPTITGRAYVTAETRLLLHDADPYRCGFVA